MERFVPMRTGRGTDMADERSPSDPDQPKSDSDLQNSKDKAKTKTLWSDLMVRTLSGVVLAFAAFFVTWKGGPAFVLFFGMAAVLVYKEWVAIVGEQKFGIPALVGYGVILASLICFYFEAWQAALILPLIGAGFLVFARCSYPYARWCASGIVYASAFGLAILGLRQDPDYGFAAIVILFALVWGTDVAAYFSGRFFGGPKLWPRVSPKKTWSGATGGLIIGAGLAFAAAVFLGIPPSFKLLVLLGFLSVLSQLGDLGESHMKRLFDVKDSSNLIPGHGGVMDRVDGLAAAVVFAGAMGLMFGGGLYSLAEAFLVW